MQTISYQDDNYTDPGLLKSKNQSSRRAGAAGHVAVREAVKAWQKTLPGRV